MDPSASIEFTRGCPWDCSFCSAWTFYGRSYRKVSPEAAAEELEQIREPNVFYNPQRQVADHHRPVTYEMRPPMNEDKSRPKQQDLCVHTPLTVSVPSA